MENLPLEIVEEICHHLTVQDLISCSAVSRDWRSIFNQDSLWKPHCRQDLEEYLRITPCIVKPAFVNPELESSSLSPVCQWRLAYMRQNHLWSNWRTGNYKTHDLGSHVYTFFEDREPWIHFDWSFQVDFFNEHYLAKIFEEKVEIWDLRDFPATKIVENFHCFPHSGQTPVFMCAGSNSDMMVFRFGTGVQVFKMEEALKSISLKHMFYFTDSQKFSENTDKVASEIIQYKFYSIPNFATTVGSVFLGFSPNASGKSALHIWDLEKGEKIREVMSPKKHARIICVKGSKNSDGLLVTCESFSEVESMAKQDFHKQYFFCIYNTKLLSFYSFIITDITKDTVGTINKNFVLCSHGTKVTIYNYKTSEKVISTCISFGLSGIQDLDQGFVIMDRSRTIHTFNTSTFSLKSFRCEEDLMCFESLGGNFVRMEFLEPEFQTYTWEMCSRMEQINVSLPEGDDTVTSNKTCTRIVIKEDFFGEWKITVRCFW
ncbi:hypothetical protein J6590_033232 [Homalodisca vitripennis]|nr:hypothetical protein J6590_033232 [Homalodisca vitripennis]